MLTTTPKAPNMFYTFKLLFTYLFCVSYKAYISSFVVVSLNSFTKYLIIHWFKKILFKIIV